jgi:hypothetical protein
MITWREIMSFHKIIVFISIFTAILAIVTTGNYFYKKYLLEQSWENLSYLDKDLGYCVQFTPKYKSSFLDGKIKFSLENRGSGEIFLSTNLSSNSKKIEYGDEYIYIDSHTDNKDIEVSITQLERGGEYVTMVVRQPSGDPRGILPMMGKECVIGDNPMEIKEVTLGHGNI